MHENCEIAGKLWGGGLIGVGAPGEPRPWQVYSVSAESGEMYGEPFLYFVERGEPRTMTIEELPEAEVFNGDLQKVDVTDTASVLRFCNKYGLPVSAAYPGAARLEWFRRRFDEGVRPYVPIDMLDEVSAARAVMAKPDQMVVMNSPGSLRDSLPQDLVGERPYLLSERAREITLDDRDAVGAVSEAEVCQTMRALQIATVLPMSYQYFSLNGGTSCDLLGYLSERRYLAQSGPAYFLHVDDDIFGGMELGVFERSLSASAYLAEIAIRGEENGLDVRAGYYSAAADALMVAANSALRFLLDASSAYREIDFDWGEGTDKLRAGFFGRLSSALVNREKKHDVLPDLSANGSLGEALIHQFFRIFADPVPWRRCENCGRIFKKYREEKYRKNIRETRFCRRSCNVSFNQRKHG